jgi:mono/diheme cytochrome c family protein
VETLEAGQEEAVAPAPSAPVIGAATLPAAPAAVVTTTVSGKPPVLIGKADNPMGVLIGAVGLFVAVFLVALVGPALPSDEPGARSSDLPYTELALHGQDVYQSVGCAACHTQMVRPIVADVGLGGVSLNDSNQVLGTRRFGPDLSDAGTRLSSSQIEAIVTGFGGHAALSLSTDDLESLVAYLVESTTSVAGEDSGAPEDGTG